MVFPVFIALITLQSLVYCSDLPICGRPHKWQDTEVILDPEQGDQPDNDSPWHGPIRYPFHPDSKHDNCPESCRGKPPKTGSVAFSPISIKSVVEKVELVCDPSPGNRIKKVIIQNNHLKYNATCNGVLSGVEKNPGTVYHAVIIDKHNKETIVPLKSSLYRYTASYNMASESFSENAELKDCICDGGQLSSYSVWIADDPNEGCCTGGVMKSTAVYYKLEIRGGNCCTVCRLLAATDEYDTPLKNF